jgi:hypothetical protein
MSTAIPAARPWSAFQTVRLVEFLTLYDLLHVASAGLLSAAAHEEMSTLLSVLPLAIRGVKTVSTDAPARSVRVTMHLARSRALCSLELPDAETIFSGPPLFKRGRRQSLDDEGSGPWRVTVHPATSRSQPGSERGGLERLRRRSRPCVGGGGRTSRPY